VGFLQDFQILIVITASTLQADIISSSIISALRLADDTGDGNLSYCTD
jgi:hypothetical protein